MTNTMAEPDSDEEEEVYDEDGDEGDEDDKDKEDVFDPARGDDDEW